MANQIPEGALEVGHTPEGKVGIKFPSEKGICHIIFSPVEARCLADLLNRKADELQPNDKSVAVRQFTDAITTFFAGPRSCCVVCNKTRPTTIHSINRDSDDSLRVSQCAFPNSHGWIEIHDLGEYKNWLYCPDCKGTALIHPGTV